MSENDERVIKEALELLRKDKNAVFADVLTAQIDEAVDQVNGDSSAHIESATELTVEEKAKIESFLAKKFVRRMNFMYTVNKNLLGGFKIKVGDWKVDGTLAYYLQQMKDVLIGGMYG